MKKKEIPKLESLKIFYTFWEFFLLFLTINNPRSKLLTYNNLKLLS